MTKDASLEDTAMEPENRLSCLACNRPLVECECPSGEPARGDLVTDDLVAFYLHGGHGDGVAFRVRRRDDWKTVVLTWMWKRKDYPNVWFVTDECVYRQLGLDTPDDREDI